MVFSLHTHRKSVKNPHLFLLLILPFRKITSLSFYLSFIFDYLKVDVVMFINYFSIYVYNNHKNYLIGGGEWKLLFERLALEWSDKSSFHSSPKSNWWTNDKIIIDLLTHFLQIIKSYPQIEWQITYFLVQSYLKLGKIIYFYRFLMDNFRSYPHFFSFSL